MENEKFWDAMKHFASNHTRSDKFENELLLYFFFTFSTLKSVIEKIKFRFQNASLFTLQVKSCFQIYRPLKSVFDKLRSGSGNNFCGLVWKVDLTVRRCFVSNLSGVVCRSVDGTLKHYYKSGGDKICLYEKTSQYE